MTQTEPIYRSKRAREIITEAGDLPVEDQPSSIKRRTLARVETVKSLRDAFDNQGREVGLRDSSWVIMSVLVLLLVGITWGNPVGLDLFARLLVVGGGMTMAGAVAARQFLGSD